MADYYNDARDTYSTDEIDEERRRDKKDRGGKYDKKNNYYGKCQN